MPIPNNLNILMFIIRMNEQPFILEFVILGRASVENFTVVHPSYGSIMFEGRYV